MPHKKNILDKLIDRANEVMGKELTTKDRKSLKASTFCGPGRSFPVPDCKHVAVAKTYLGRAKFSSSTKKKIAACINRKAKALGCGVTKKAKAGKGGKEREFPIFIQLTYQEKKLYAAKAFDETKQLVEASIKTPGLDLYENA